MLGALPVHRLRQPAAIFKWPSPFFMNPILWVCAFFVIDGVMILRIIPKLGTGLCFLAFLFTATRQPGSIRVFLTPKVMWAGIAMTILYFLLARIHHHGPYAGYASGLIAYRLLRVIPILLMGMYLANTRHGIFFAIATMLCVNAFMSILMVRYNIGFEAAVGQSAARIMHSEGTTLDAALAGVGGVHSAAARAYVVILTMGLFLSIRKHLNTLSILAYIGMLFATLLGTLFSGFTTPMLLVFLAMSFFGAFQITRVRTWFFIAGGLAAIFIAYQIALVLDLQSILSQFEKALTLFDVVLGDEQIDSVPRYFLFMHSLNTFLHAPLFGVGGYLFIPDLWANPIGGHSTFIDWPAQFGIVGVTGLIIIGVSIVQANLHLKRSGRARDLGPFAVILKIYFLVFLVHSLGNPTLAAPNIDVMTALTLGFIHGLALSSAPFSSMQPAFPFNRFKVDKTNWTAWN